MQYKIFGCKVNKYYTDKWLNSDFMKDKQGIFVASCVVTDQAKRKWIKFLKEEIKNLKKGQKIYLSGCGAFDRSEIDKDFYEKYEDLKEFREKIIILPEDPKQLNKLDISKYLEKTKGIYTKKFVLIQGGCDSFCSFCLTVQKRGKHYYRAKEDIVGEINEFYKNGGKEVVLTGINLSAWGQESTNDFKNPKFKYLIKHILENTEIPRIRISSLGPEFIDDETIKLFENKRIYPHFHVSVQSGSTNVLKNMKRHYFGEYIKNLLLKLRNLKREDDVLVSIGADIIVGFPGESEEDFKETLDLIKECKITKVHAFPFSGHKFGDNVPAGFFKNQISDKVKKERMNRILELSERIRNDFIKENIGIEFEILVEVVGEDGIWKGWTQNYIESSNENIKIVSGEIKRNEIVIGKLVK